MTTWNSMYKITFRFSLFGTVFERTRPYGFAYNHYTYASIHLHILCLSQNKLGGKQFGWESILRRCIATRRHWRAGSPGDVGRYAILYVGTNCRYILRHFSRELTSRRDNKYNQHMNVPMFAGTYQYYSLTVVHLCDLLCRRMWGHRLHSLAISRWILLDN